MDFKEVISMLASIVAIVGGVLGIVSSLSKEPVFLRFWQRQAPLRTPPVLQPSPVLPKPVVDVASSSGVQEQTNRNLPSNRFKLGIVYGLVSGVLSLLILIGALALIYKSQFHIANQIALIGLCMLCIVAGLFPSRASGSLLSSGIAGGILGLFSSIGVFIGDAAFAVIHAPPSGILLFAVLPFIVSMLFGLLGRYLHERFQVSR